MIADKALEVAAAVIISGEKFLMAQRKGGCLDGLWEFPGGKIELGETAQEAAEREIKEELGLQVKAIKTILILEHTYPDKKVRLNFVLCSAADKPADFASQAENKDASKWFTPLDAAGEKMCPADAAAFKQINWSKLFELNIDSGSPLILVINPGSRTTKLGVFRGLVSLKETEISHSVSDLSQYKYACEQLDYRYASLIEALKSMGFKAADFDGVIGRGGPLKPVESGVYAVNEAMLQDIKKGGATDHASLLGGLLAHRIGTENHIPAFIADPVSVDEFQDVARISGLPQLPRVSLIHALNIKAVAEETAAAEGKSLDQVNYIVAHLGGGISISPVRKGKLIDVNNANEGGPMSSERCGTIPLVGVLKMCYSGKYTYPEIFKMMIGKGGMYAYLGTSDCREAEAAANNGDQQSKLILEAMAYQIAKEIGSMAAVLKGEVNKIILTGGAAGCRLITDYITDHVKFIAPVVVRPGQNEMKALARHAARALADPNIVKTY